MYCMCLAAGFTKVRTAAAAFYGVLIKSLASLKGTTRIYFTFNVFYNFRTSRAPTAPPFRDHVHPPGKRDEHFSLYTQTYIIHTRLPSVHSYLFAFVLFCFSTAVPVRTSSDPRPPLRINTRAYVCCVRAKAVKVFRRAKGLLVGNDRRACKSAGLVFIVSYLYDIILFATGTTRRCYYCAENA